MNYPLRFINSVINEFQKGKECGDKSFIIPATLFEIKKPSIFVEIPFRKLNEIKSKYLKKFHKFTNNSFRMVITWKTRNIRSLFSLKEKKDYKLCIIYKGNCSWGSRYIGEIKSNAEVRWNGYNNPTESSEPSKNLRSNINHYFAWAVISNALQNAKGRKYHILLSGNLILTNKRTLKDYFYLEMVSYKVINDIMQSPKKEQHFFFFSVCYIIFNWY